KVVKSASPTSVREGGVGGDQVTYTYLVTNTSPAGASDPLSSVSLSDTDGTPTAVLNGDGFNVGDSNEDNILQAGETWKYTLTVTPPAQDVGTSHTNKVTATGKDDEGNTATGTDTATITYTNVAPAIKVVKSADPTSVREGGVGGDQVTYTYLVTNTSPAGASDPLSSVTLSDTDGTPAAVLNGDGFNVGDSNEDNILQAGETWKYTLTVTPPAQDVGTSHTNKVTATGTDDEGNTATGTDTATISYTNVAPAIKVVKSASPASVREGGVGGDQVTYTYLVTNTSPAGASDPLHGISVSDSDGAPAAVVNGDGFNVGDSNEDNILQAGETWQYTLTVTPPAGDATGGSHTNTATATGTDDETNTVSSTATATITYPTRPSSILVVKSANPSSAREGGVGGDQVT